MYIFIIEHIEKYKDKIYHQWKITKLKKKKKRNHFMNPIIKLSKPFSMKLILLRIMVGKL